MDILISELEAMAADAFPALESEIYDGWQLRYSAGYTYRGNCVVPLSDGDKPLDEKLACCEQWFAAYNLPCVFKIIKLAPLKLAVLLQDRDYKIVKTVHCLYKKITDLPIEHFAPYEIEISRQFSFQWLENILQFMPLESSRNVKVWQEILQSISKPVIYIQAKAGMKCIGGCMGVVERGYVGLFALHVDRNFQRQGIATKLCKALLSAAGQQGAHTAYLQVADNNLTALALYNKLAFKNAYQYQFYVKSYPGANNIED